MAQESVLKEIRSLRAEIGQMSGHLVSMRYEDFRQAFVDEVAEAAREEGAWFFDEHLSNVQGVADCRMRAGCAVKMKEAVSQLEEDLRRDDTESARAKLVALEGALCGEGSPCQDKSCSDAGIETVARVRAVLDVYERVRARLQKEESSAAVRSKSAPPSAEGMERALAPLANARRLEALRLLASEELSLSEMARRMGIPSGHLHYHVVELMKAGMISQVRGRRLYSITPKGRAALGLAESMASSLARTPA